MQDQYKKKQKYLKVLHFKNESVITNILQRNIEGYNALIVNSSKIGKKKTIATTRTVLEKNSRDLKIMEYIATHFFEANINLVPKYDKDRKLTGKIFLGKEKFFNGKSFLMANTCSNT